MWHSTHMTSTHLRTTWPAWAIALSAVGTVAVALVAVAAFENPGTAAGISTVRPAAETSTCDLTTSSNFLDGQTATAIVRVLEPGSSKSLRQVAMTVGLYDGPVRIATAPLVFTDLPAGTQAQQAARFSYTGSDPLTCNVDSAVDVDGPR